MKISVVIHTYNSEKFLERVLNSVSGFDEIVICDMYSTDKTLEIAKKYNTRIIFHEPCNPPEPARNFAIHSATWEWVLVVDSDEVVPLALKQYLYAYIRQSNPPEGLWIPRKNYLMGRFMHGDYPDYILRFFRKEGAYWPPYVHTVPQLAGKTVKIPKHTNKGNGQLIYSTHDTVNLNKEIFRRDEIWFTEKDKDGISTIYSLADYKINDVKVRNDATYNKDYLSGRYGAIPVLENFVKF